VIKQCEYEKTRRLMFVVHTREERREEKRREEKRREEKRREEKRREEKRRKAHQQM